MSLRQKNTEIFLQMERRSRFTFGNHFDFRNRFGIRYPLNFLYRSSLEISLCLLLSTGMSALAATNTESIQSAPTKTVVKKSTEVSFEDVLVQGKYHFSDEAVTTVEQDKVLDALLSVRKDFKDRMKKSAERH